MVALTTGIIGASISAIIIFLIRRDHMHVSNGLVWILVAIAFALLGFSPSLIDQLASRLGVAYPPILAVTLAIAMITLKFLLIDIEKSKLEVRNQRLVQRIAMLEADLKKLELSSNCNTSRKET